MLFSLIKLIFYSLVTTRLGRINLRIIIGYRHSSNRTCKTFVWFPYGTYTFTYAQTCRSFIILVQNCIQSFWIFWIFFYSNCDTLFMYLKVFESSLWIYSSLFLDNRIMYTWYKKTRSQNLSCLSERTRPQTRGNYISGWPWC